MAGRKPIPILLKSTSPEGEVRFFETTKEASEGLGFSECGVGKAYHAGRNRIGEYKLQWFKPREKPKEEKPKRKRKAKPETILTKIKENKVLNCFICGEPLEKKDRKDYGHLYMERLDRDGNVIWSSGFDNMYRASKESGVSLNTLWNTQEKGNSLIVRRRDKVPFKLWWGSSHNRCFEDRKERRRLEERELRIEEENKRRRMLSEMTKEEREAFKRKEEEEQDKRDIEFNKKFERRFGKGI